MKKYFTFKQTNSGGFLKTSSFDGIGKIVIVVAPNAYEANRRAEDIGLYFDGVRKGIDCACCGDRWRPVFESDGHDVPTYYGDPIDEDYVLHHYSGNFEYITFDKDEFYED